MSNFAGPLQAIEMPAAIRTIFAAIEFETFTAVTPYFKTSDAEQPAPITHDKTGVLLRKHG